MKRLATPSRLKKLLAVAAVGSVFAANLISSSPATAATNSYINFQARLLNSTGSVVLDGNYNVEFKIYDTNSSSGSSQGSCTGDAHCLWTETRTGANVVRVAGGYLSVQLGSVTAFPSTIHWDQQLYLTMNIGGTSGSPVWDGEMLNSGSRLPLTGVPFAFYSTNTFNLQNSSYTTLLTGGSSSSISAPQATSAANALYFGGDTTADLYRPSSAVLETDGALAVGANLNAKLSVQTGALVGLAINQTGSSDILDLKSNSTNVLTINSTGLTTFQNATDSSSAFTVKNSGGTQVLGVDTTNLGVNVTSLQATGTISLQNGQGASIQLRTSSASSTGLTASGGLITDSGPYTANNLLSLSRSAALQGEGTQPPDSSTGFWETATNLLTNGGFESGNSGWTTSSANTTSFAADNSTAKFGSSSDKVVLNSSGNSGIRTNGTSLTSGQPYSAGAWVKATAGKAMALQLVRADFATVVAQTTFTGTGNWQYVTTSTTSYPATETGYIFIKGTSSGVDTFWVDGVQLENKGISTPYIETNGSTQSRTEGKLTAPTSALTINQGWVAARVRMGFASTATLPAVNAVILSFDDGTNNERIQLLWSSSGHNWQVRRCHLGSCDTSPQVTDSFSQGDIRTVVMRWDTTPDNKDYLSINGAAFGTGTAIAQTPTGINNLVIGTTGVGNNSFDGDIFWLATGTGLLTDADSSTLYKYGNSDPTLTNLSALNSSTATPTLVWDGEGTQYSGINTSYTNQSQLAIDDVNLTHTANGSLALQGSTNSTTAFQVQNAAAAPVFVVDTTSTDSLGNQVNYLTYPGFESGSFSNASAGWAPVSPAALSQNVAKQHTYNGLYSAQVATTSSNGGLTTSSFAVTPASGTYIISFYAKVSSGTMASTAFTVQTTDGTTHTCSPSAGVTINSSGFQRLYCSITATGTITALQITQNDGTGRTIYIDAVQLQKNSINGSTITAPSAYQVGAIQLRGTITNPVTLQNNADSTAAFQIQSANSNTVLVVDTLNSRVAVGSTAAPANGVLTVGTNTTAATGGIYFGTDTNLYRSAANTLKTDGNLTVGGTLTVSSSTTFTNSGLIQTDSATAFAVKNTAGNTALNVDTTNSLVSVTNLQASGTIGLQGADGGSILLRTAANSGVGAAMTFSGYEITDSGSGSTNSISLSRTASLQGDGRAPSDSSTGVWESTTNLNQNGGFEGNITGWVNNSNATVAQSSAASKFGSKSLAVSSAAAGVFNAAGTTTRVAVSPNTQYTVSGWLMAPISRTVFLQASEFAASTGGSSLVVNSASQAVTAGIWTRVSFTFTTGASTNYLQFYVGSTTAATAAGEKVYADGLQVEAKAIATPYVETNGSSASRTNAGAVTAPATNVLNANTGWFATRVRMGFANTSLTAVKAEEGGADPRIMEWGTTSDRMAIVLTGSGNVQIFRTIGGVQTSLSVAATWNAGDILTIVGMWDATKEYMSVNGSAFTNATASPPTISATTFNIASSPNAAASVADSDVLWAAAGTGALSSTDASNIYKLGNADPSISSINSIDTAAAPTYAWDGEGSQYSGANNDPTLQSGISIDDVNLYHAGNGNLTLQGSTNSVTAFQVLNTAGSIALNVDTVNDRVGIGTAAPARDLEVVDASNPQLRLTYTAGSIYTDFQTNSNGYLLLSPTGGRIGVGVTPNADIQIGNGNSTTHHAIDNEGYDTAAGYAQYLGNWSSSNRWGIGPLTGTNDSTIQIGIVSSTLGTWNGTQNLTLAVGGSNLAFKGASTATVSAASGQSIQLQSGDTSHYVLLQPSGGNVGINTAGPDRKLDVLDASNPQLRLTQADGTVYTDLQTTSSGYLYINPSGGRVGILNSSPSYPLDVTGDINTSANIRTGGSVRIDSSGNYTGGTINSNTFDATHLTFSGASPTITNTGTGTIALDTANTSGLINIGTTNATTTVGRSGAALTLNGSNFSVTSGGNVTASGTYNTNTFNSSTLQFGAASAATVQAASGQNLKVNAGTSSQYVLLQSGGGNVGIGLSGSNTFTSPQASLDVNGGIAIRGYTTSNTQNTNNGQWTELGSCTIGSQFDGCDALIQIIGGTYNGQTGGDESVNLNWRVKQQAAFGSNPQVNLEAGQFTGTSGISVDDFVAVTTQNTPTTIVQLWGKIDSTFQAWNFSPTLVQYPSSTGSLTFLNSQGFSVSAPAGIAQTAAIYQSFQAGSNSTPSITFAGNLNTGIYQPATNVIGFTNNGTENVAIDASGNLNVINGAIQINGSPVIDHNKNFTGGTVNTNTFDATHLTFSGASPTITNTGTGTVTLQAAGTGTLVLNTAGAGTVNLGTSNATTVAVGNTSASLTLESNSTANLFNGNTAHNISIGAGGSSTTQVIAIGSTGSASSLALKVGTGNFSLDGVTNSTYNVGASTTTGTILVGGTAQTGNITLGSSSGTNSVLIGNGAGATTVSIANANAAGAVNVGTAFTTGTIAIGGTAQTGNITLGSSSGTNNVLIANGAGASTVNIANVQNGGAVNIGAGMTTGTITIGGTGAQTGTIAIGTGTGVQALNFATGGTGAKTVTLGSTASTSSLLLQSGTGALNIQTQGTGGVNIATNSVAQVITIGNITGASGIAEKVGTGNFSLDGVTNSTYSLGASTTTGTILIGGTAQTGNITLGSSSGTNSVLIGNGAGATTVSISNANAAGAVNVGTAFTTGTISLGGTAQTGNLTLGSSSGTNTEVIAGGSGATTLQIANVQTAGAVNVGAGMTTGTISLGGTAQTGTITLGQFSGSGTNTLNFGANAGASSTQQVNIASSSNGINTVNIGSTNSTSATNIKGGQSGINLTASGASNTGIIAKTSANSTAAFQIQNQSSASVFTADTSNNQLLVTNTNPNTNASINVSASSLINNLNGSTDANFGVTAVGTDTSGNAYIAYYDQAANKLKFIHCSNAACTSGSTTALFTGFVSNLTMSVGSDGNARLAWMSSSTYFLECTNQNCTSNGGVQFIVSTSEGGTAVGPAIALNATDGFPRLAFPDFTGTNGVPSLAVCANAACSSSTVFNLGTADSENVSITMSGNNPIITYYDDTNTRVVMLDCTTTTCSTKTTTVIATSTSPFATATIMASDGFPRIAYTLGGSIVFQQCQILTCATKITGTISTSTSFQSFLNIAIAASDSLPRIMTTNSSSTMVFIQCSTSNCSSSTVTNVDSSGTTNLYFDAGALGSDGFGRFVHLDSTQTSIVFDQCTTTSCSSGTNINTAPLVAPGSGYYNSTAIGPDGYARISYYDNVNDELRYMVCTNATCTSSSVATVESGDDVGRYSSLALGSDGLARIAYYDNTTGHLKFVQCASNDCTSRNIATVDTATSVGTYISMAVGSDGFAQISYYDATNNDLKFVHCTSLNCSTHDTIQTLDSTGDVGQYTSLGIGSDGFAQIAYYDNTNHDLKFVHCTNLSCSTHSTIQSVATTSDSGQYASLAIGSDGFARITYYQSGGSSGVYFAQCTNISCSTSNINAVDTTSTGIGAVTYSSAISSKDGFARIAYVNAGHLYFIICTNAICTTTIKTDAGSVSSGNAYFTSMAIGADGLARVTYDDFANSQIKFFLQTGTAATASGINLGAASTALFANVNSAVLQSGYALIKPTADTTTAFQIQSSGGTVMFTADTTDNLIIVGSASSTPTLLVLANKNDTASDPTTCTNGGVYYNSVSEEFRGCTGGTWRTLGADSQLDYAELSSNYTASTTPGAVITGQALTYDGNTRIRVEFNAALTGAGSGAFRLYLYEDGSQLGGWLENCPLTASGATSYCPVDSSVFVTPTAGQHTFAIYAATSTGSGTVYAGGSYMNAWYRITLE